MPSELSQSRLDHHRQIFGYNFRGQRPSPVPAHPVGNQEQLQLSLGFSLRVYPPKPKRFNGYLALGPRVYLLRTAERSTPTGVGATEQHNRTASRAGLFALLGGEATVGPGANRIQHAGSGELRPRTGHPRRRGRRVRPT